MSDKITQLINIEGYFETIKPFKINRGQFVDKDNNPIDDISSIFDFKMYPYSDAYINKLEQNKLYTVVIPPGDIKRGGKSKKKRGGNKRKTKSNRNKR
jgi:hypothetical protein